MHKYLEDNLIFERYDKGLCVECGEMLNENLWLEGTGSSVNCNGVIIHHGKNFVTIATGIIRPSENEKTGEMIQIYTILSDIDPVEAINNGKDATICFNCIHRKLGSCYVNVGREVKGIYNAYKKGNYPFIVEDPENIPIGGGEAEVDFYVNNGKWKEYFGGRSVRFGAYGDPVKIPLEIVKKIVEVSSGHTGYTHQWYVDGYQKYKDYYMASCDTVDEFKKATKMGWGTFRVLGDWNNINKDERICDFALNGTQCIDCLKCSGGVGNKFNIAVKVHGAKWKVNEFLKSFNDPSLQIDSPSEEQKQQIKELESKEKPKPVLGGKKEPNPLERFLSR